MKRLICFFLMVTMVLPSGVAVLAEEIPVPKVQKKESVRRKNYETLRNEAGNVSMLPQQFQKLFGTGYSDQYIRENYAEIFDFYEGELIDEAILDGITKHTEDFSTEKASICGLVYPLDAISNKISLQGIEKIFTYFYELPARQVPKSDEQRFSLVLEKLSEVGGEAMVGAKEIKGKAVKIQIGAPEELYVIAQGYLSKADTGYKIKKEFVPLYNDQGKLVVYAIPFGKNGVHMGHMNIGTFDNGIPFYLVDFQDTTYYNLKRHYDWGWTLDYIGPFDYYYHKEGYQPLINGDLTFDSGSVLYNPRWYNQENLIANETLLEEIAALEKEKLTQPIFWDGKIATMKNPMLSRNDEAYVPLRMFCDLEGVRLTWDNKKKESILRSEDLEISIGSDTNVISIKNRKTGDRRTQPLDFRKPQVRTFIHKEDQLLYVPLHAICKVLEVQAIWNSRKKATYVMSDDTAFETKHWVGKKGEAIFFFGMTQKEVYDAALESGMTIEKSFLEDMVDTYGCTTNISPLGTSYTMQTQGNQHFRFDENKTLIEVGFNPLLQGVDTRIAAYFFTKEGLRRGDSLEKMKRLYPNIQCTSGAEVTQVYELPLAEKEVLEIIVLEGTVTSMRYFVRK